MLKVDPEMMLGDEPLTFPTHQLSCWIEQTFLICAAVVVLSECVAIPELKILLESYK